MRLFAVATGMLTVVALGGTTRAEAQDWTGPYVAGSIGAGFQRRNPSETIRFDTNLDGSFADPVRTIAGADAFAPGFCGGLAVGPTAAGGCTDDENGIDVGGRAGYDRQFGRVVVGGVVDVSRTQVVDSATAFSVTPAFYSFTRELTHVTSLRGRAGFGNGRVLVYGTGGGAWGHVEQRFTTSNIVNTFVPSDDDADTDGDEGSGESVWGYQAGGGVEIGFGGRWLLTGEYLFTSLDNRDASVIRAQGPAPATNAFILVNAAGTEFRRSEPFEFQGVRAGLSYRF